MTQWTAIGLAAALWPLLTALLWGVFRLPGKRRAHSLLILGAGAVAGIALVTLFTSPMLLRGGDILPPLVFDRKMWVHYGAAAPLGSLIALFLTEFLKDD